MAFSATLFFVASCNTMNIRTLSNDRFALTERCALIDRRSLILSSRPSDSKIAVSVLCTDWLQVTWSSKKCMSVDLCTCSRWRDLASIAVKDAVVAHDSRVGVRLYAAKRGRQLQISSVELTACTEDAVLDVGDLTFTDGALLWQLPVNVERKSLLNNSTEYYFKGDFCGATVLNLCWQ
jgi:hypothetical protein